MLGVAAACTSEPQSAPQGGLARFEHQVMGTVIEAVLPQSDQPDRDATAARSAFAAFDDVDREMSEWRDDSPLSAINRAAGGAPLPAPPALREILRRAREISERSDGAFDVTWAALAGVWSFQALSPSLPSAAELERARSLVDYRLVEIDEPAGTVRLARPGMKIGLGGIAKGNALARAGAALRAAGVHAFLLSAGGQVLAGERDPTIGPWRVGIRDPRGPRDDFFAAIELDSTSVSTSGDYERFFLLDGKRYHHILDPRTGTPARGLRSATIVAQEPVLADALSTAVMVLGREGGRALVATFPGVEALVVDERGEVEATRGLEARLRIAHAPREAGSSAAVQPIAP